MRKEKKQKVKKERHILRSFFQSLKNPRNLIVFVVIASICAVALFLFANRQTDIDKVSMDYAEVFDNEVLKTNIETKFKNTYELSDYAIYGENLILYESQYEAGEVDGLQGKSVVLRNVVTDSEIIFTISDGIDSGINLSRLDEGLYEVYIYDHYKKKRVFFNEEFESEKLYTIRRNDETKSVVMNTQKDFLSEIGVEMDENYAFITVIDNTPIASVYDVVIDPSPNVVDISTNAVDYGYSSDTFNENDTSYQLAELLKEYLEKEGLRVLITREKDETLSYYGSKGRAGIGYESGAKVYIALGACEDDEIAHPYLITSPYSNSLLANEIAYCLKEEGIALEDVDDDEQLQEGVMWDERYQEYDANLGYMVYTPYEMQPQIRETGGKLTKAGTMDGTTENQMYSQSYGMYGIYFTYCNVNNADSVNYIVNNDTLIARQLANGICDYFDINT